jgi:hypothetical protein
VDGRTRRILGSVEFAIPVTSAALILDREIRNLSILKHIGLTIPESNRWWPIFQRYLVFLGDRVDALGGNSAQVQSPNISARQRTGKLPRARRQRRAFGQRSAWVSASLASLPNPSGFPHT